MKRIVLTTLLLAAVASGAHAQDPKGNFQDLRMVMRLTMGVAGDLSGETPEESRRRAAYLLGFATAFFLRCPGLTKAEEDAFGERMNRLVNNPANEEVVAKQVRPGIHDGKAFAEIYGCSDSNSGVKNARELLVDYVRDINDRVK